MAPAQEGGSPLGALVLGRGAGSEGGAVDRCGVTTQRCRERGRGSGERGGGGGSLS